MVPGTHLPERIAKGTTRHHARWRGSCPWGTRRLECLRLLLPVLFHDALVGLRVGVDLVLQRVELQLADAIELVGRQRHVRCQGEQAHHEERRGVVCGRDGG